METDSQSLLHGFCCLILVCWDKFSACIPGWPPVEILFPKPIKCWDHQCLPPRPVLEWLCWVLHWPGMPLTCKFKGYPTLYLWNMTKKCSSFWRMTSILSSTLPSMLSHPQHTPVSHFWSSQSLWLLCKDFSLWLPGGYAKAITY